MNTTVRRATAAAVITAIAVFAVIIGWYGLTKAWGDGTICDAGITHTFDNESDYYAYLDAHPEAKEGSCSSTTTAPASTVSPTTSAAATTTSTSGSTTSSAPDTTSASSGPSTSDDSTPSTVVTECVAPDVLFEDGSCGAPYPDAPTTLPGLVCVAPNYILDGACVIPPSPTGPPGPPTCQLGTCQPYPSTDDCLDLDGDGHGTTRWSIQPCTIELSTTPDAPSTTTPSGTLPVTGGPGPHDLLWGLGVVALGLGLVRIGMRRRTT